jgi:hypothetical protein
VKTIREVCADRPRTTAAGIFGVPLLVVGLYVGDFKATADESHRTTAELVTVVDGLVDLREKEQVAKETREAELAKRRAELADLCRRGELTNRGTCASVDAPLAPEPAR